MSSTEQSSAFDDHSARTVAVVIACYTEARWDLTLRAVDSVRNQSAPAHEIYLVVDNNDALLERLRGTIQPDVHLLPNTFHSGAGGARNTAALNTESDFVAFLDDDAAADPDWLKHLLTVIAADSQLVGGGGTISPDWSVRQPWWFPLEFAWVIGCRDEGPERRVKPVRNLWSVNMIVDRAAFVASGGFRDDFGKVGQASEPEDTELCLRLAHETGRGWVFVPDAVVRHHVAPSRESFGYFLRRCALEGSGKASMARLKDHGDLTLADEHDYVRRELPAAFIRYLRNVGRGRLSDLGKAGMLVVGVGWTTAFFVAHRLKFLLRKGRAR